MIFVYRTGIALYGVAARFLALFKEKPRKWVEGRRDWRNSLKKGMAGKKDPIWVHCSSLGEFEQGRPLIEKIRAKFPEKAILLTFFSPSGYEIRKNYQQADHVCYLPLDTRRNVRDFLDIVKPSLAVFVKYDLWLNFLFELQERSIPNILVSAIVGEKSRFLTSGFKSLYRKAFRGFTWIFTQDQKSLDLLRDFSGSEKISVAGDTRFDRAAELPEKFFPVPGIEAFIDGHRCIVAGSPWPKDEELILPVIESLESFDLKWIIAPHEIHPSRIDAAIAKSGGKMAKYSAIGDAGNNAKVLWIDNIGMLSRLYYYADLVYIGGGFGTSIHNTQEPAVYGKPIAFGPKKFDTFREAVDMVESGGAVCVHNAQELEKAFRSWLEEPEKLAAASKGNAEYMRRMAGATEIVMKKLEELKLL